MVTLTYYRRFVPDTDDFDTVAEAMAFVDAQESDGQIYAIKIEDEAGQTLARRPKPFGPLEILL